MRYAFQPVDGDGARALLDRIWEVSQDTDDQGFRPRNGWWSLSGWAARALLLSAGETAIGGIALNQSPDGAQEVRLALLPEHRTPEAAQRLVCAAIAGARASTAPRLRMVLPAGAIWAREAAGANGLAVARSTLVMLRPATLGLLPAAEVSGIHIRPLAVGGEGRLLHALNHAWAGTWNFRPLTRRALERDLADQRAGFLLAIGDDRRIAGTVHAQFDPSGRNPDGAPFAWLSNLTTAPEWRGRGLGRALLSAGIAHLHARGAGSVTLGVDSGATAPLTLYRTAGFAEIDRLELWEIPAPSAAVADMVQGARCL